MTYKKNNVKHSQYFKNCRKRIFRNKIFLLYYFKW